MSGHSPFMSLPPELRIRIYSFVFVPSRPHERYSSFYKIDGSGHAVGVPPDKEFADAPARRCHLEVDAGRVIEGSVLGDWDWKECTPQAKATAVLRTCKLAYQEAIDVLYDSTLIVINVHAGLSRKVRPFREKAVLGRLEECAILKRARHCHLVVQMCGEWDLRQASGRIKSIIDRFSSPSPAVFVRLFFNNRAFYKPFAAVRWQQFVRDLRLMPLNYQIEARDRFWLLAEGLPRFLEVSNALGWFKVLTGSLEDLTPIGRGAHLRHLPELPPGTQALEF